MSSNTASWAKIDRSERRFRVAVVAALIVVILAPLYFAAVNYAARIALRNNDIPADMTLIRLGADVNQTDALGYSAIACLAPGANTTRQIEWFLAHGANPNLASDQGETPLIDVSREGPFSVLPSVMANMELLVDHGADVNAIDDQGDTALTVAAGQGNIQIVRFLVEHGANVNYVSPRGDSPIWEADSAGLPGSNRSAVVAYLLDHGARAYRRPGKYDGGPLLFCALENPSTVAALLAHGANANEPGADGNTPIQEAALMGYADAVPLLAAHGANLNARNPKGATPLAVARMVWDYGTIADYKATYYALLKAGANPYAPTVAVRSPYGPWPGAPPIPADAIR